MNLYVTAFSLLGKHLTMDESVDKSVGCAEALSYVFMKSGLELPYKGLPGTKDIDKWCKENLRKVETPDVGDVIVSITDSGNGSVRGHCGIVGKHHVMSNNSLTGLWDDHWTLEEWLEHYKVKGDLETNFYCL